jgi:hypothetical protein
MSHDKWEKGLISSVESGLEFKPVMTYVIDSMTYVMFIYLSTQTRSTGERI